MERKNKNRGYQRLRVWEDAVALYVETCQRFRSPPFEMKRIAGQALASADSVHRNIAEGYCRRSVREYIHHLYNHSITSLLHYSITPPLHHSITPSLHP
ncbi:MAG TPA: four helix bundle protein [Chthoniobacterales bacterium]